MRSIRTNRFNVEETLENIQIVPIVLQYFADMLAPSAYPQWLAIRIMQAALSEQSIFQATQRGNIIVTIH